MPDGTGPRVMPARGQAPAIGAEDASVVTGDRVRDRAVAALERARSEGDRRAIATSGASRSAIASRTS